MHLPHALFACAAFTAALSAQTTWTVDASNGPGTNFTEIQSAVNAASPGDVILVRPGAYQPFSVSKGVRILGTPSFGFASGLPPAVVPVTVHDLPAGQTFVLANATITLFFFLPSSWISIVDSLGHVHLQNVVFDPELQVFAVGPTGLTVSNSADVTVADCTFPIGSAQSQGVFLPTGFDPAVSVSQSDVTFVGSTIAGRNGGTFPQPFTGQVTIGSGEGLVTAGSTVHLSRCDVRGGVGTPAIVATASALTITGVATNVVVAGASTTPVPAISANSASTVHVDAQLGVQGSGGGAPLSGGATLERRRIVSLDATGGALGGTIALDAVSAQDDVCVLLLGVPYPPTPSPIGTLRINLATAVLLAQQVVPATGVTQATINVPNAVVLRGLLLGFQAANWDHTTGQIEVSNVAAVVLQ